MKFIQETLFLGPEMLKCIKMTCYLVRKISNHIVKCFFCTFLGVLLFLNWGCFLDTFSWTSLQEWSVFYLPEKNHQLKILAAFIFSGFWASSLQYVVFAYCFASKIASPLLISEPGLLLLRISQILKIRSSLSILWPQYM